MRMSTTFHLVCSANDKDWKIVSDDFLDPCHLVMKKFTPIGCPVTFMSNMTRKLMYYIGIPVLILASYFILGTLLKCYKGERGTEAIPHYEFIKSVPAWLCQKTSGLADQVKSGAGATKYEMV